MKIAITGNICSGKSYLSRILMKKYNLELYSFAEKIKKISTDLFKVQHKDRILIQTIADKMKEIDPDIWIKYLLTEINDKENIIIDDLRFENEVKYLKEHGFVIIRLNVPDNIRIERIKSTYPNNYIEHIEGMNHNSENDIANLEVDLDLNFTNDYNFTVLDTIDKFMMENCLKI
jgi:dephospho-CoA kinase